MGQGQGAVRGNKRTMADNMEVVIAKRLEAAERALEFATGALGDVEFVLEDLSAAAKDSYFSSSHAQKLKAVGKGWRDYCKAIRRISRQHRKVRLLVAYHIFITENKDKDARAFLSVPRQGPRAPRADKKIV